MNKYNIWDLSMLKDKVAIITGSTRGIGLGIAESLAQNHCNIIINGFGDVDEIEAICNKFRKIYNVSVSYSPADMTKPNEIAAMVHQANTEFGSIDILVNNAGIQHVAAIEDFPEEKWDAIIAINLSSVFHSTKAVLPYMKQQKQGRIINVASAHGLVASANKSAYVAAKHGVLGLTKVTALEQAGAGITCNAICPGWVLTPLVQKQIDAIATNQGISSEEAKLQLLSEKQPSKEFVTVDQIGAMVIYLCSTAAKNITGTSLPIDGGWTAQ